MAKTIGVTLRIKDECSANIRRIQEKFGLAEKDAARLHKQVTKTAKEMKQGLANAAKICGVGITALTAATGALVMNTMQAGDRIDKMSQKIGLSRKEFQQWDYICSQNGSNVDSLKMGFKALVNQIDKVETGNKASVRNFQDLGVSIKNSNGSMKNQEQIFNDCIKALQKMPDGVKKAKIANDLFGRSGADLMPVLRNNAKNVEELRQKFDKLGMGMSDKNVDAAVKLTDSFDSIKRSFQGVGFQISAELLPQIQSLSDKLQNNMPQIKATVVPVFNGMANAVGFVVDNYKLLNTVLVSAMAGFASYKIITGVIATYNALSLAIEGVTVAKVLCNSVMAVSPLFWISVAISATTALIMNWDKVTAAVKKAMEAMKKAVTFSIDFATGGLYSKAKNLPKGSRVSAPKNNSIAKYASGTTFAHGGLSLVGEEGPELVNLPYGARVANTRDTQKIMSKDIVVNINIGGNLWGTKEFLNEMKLELGRELKTALAV